MSNDTQVKQEAPQRVKLWICCHCQKPRTVGLTYCDGCHTQLHDTIEYARVPAPIVAPEVDNEALGSAARELLNAFHGSGHGGADIMVSARLRGCEKCATLSTALDRALFTPSAAPASTAALRDETPTDLIAFKWAETLSTGEQSVLLTSSLKRLQSMIDDARPATTPPSTLAKTAAEEILNYFGCRVDTMRDDHQAIAAIIERCLAGGGES